MRKSLLTLIFLLISFSVYPFWIWSPRTGKWKNPKYSPLSSPKAQLKEARELFEKGKYKEAIASFRKILKYYPDAKEAAEAQYYLGRCYQKLDNSYQAYLEYNKVLVSYPNSKRIQEVIRREYEIALEFLYRKERRFLGIPLDVFAENLGVEILQNIIDKATNSLYAPKSLYQLGVFLYRHNHFQEAKECFERLLNDYPQSDLIEEAKYQLALCNVKLSLPLDYDQSTTKEALSQLGELKDTYLDPTLSENTKKTLFSLKEKEAKKAVEIGQFYERIGKIKSALIYYRTVMDKYPETKSAQVAKKRLRILKSNR